MICVLVLSSFHKVGIEKEVLVLEGIGVVLVVKGKIILTEMVSFCDIHNEDVKLFTVGYFFDLS